MFAGYRHCKKCGKALMGLFDGALCDECEEEENRRMKDYEQIAINIMMNALEGVKAQIRKVYDKGYKDGIADTPFTDTEEAENKAYERGLNEAWDAARKIAQTYAHFTCYDLNRIFGDRDSVGRKMIFEEYTPQDAIRKIKEYEDKQKQDAEIKVGDEVRGIDSGKRAVILDKKYGLYRALAFDGIIHEGTEEAFTKTGRTFPEIAEVLAELRGADE